MTKSKNSENELTLDDTVDKLTSDIPFKETTELGEVFSNLDNDEIDKITNLSKIDFNTRLSHLEATNCLIVDELTSQGILEDIGITRQKKRLSVSVGGWGREGKIQVASAQKDAELKGRSGGFLSGLFSPRE